MNAPLCLLSVLLLALTHAGVSAESLRWRFGEGDVLRYEVEQQTATTMRAPHSETQMRISQRALLHWEVQSVDESGNATLRQHVRRVELRIVDPTGGEVTYDTDADDPPEGLAAMLAPYVDALVEHPITFVASAQGAVSEVELPEPLLSAVRNAPNWSLVGSPEDALIQLIQAALLPMPPEEVESGAEWQNTRKLPLPMLSTGRLETTFKYVGQGDTVDTPLAVIRPRWSLKGSSGDRFALEISDAAGQYKFDTDSGRLHSADLRLHVSLDADALHGETQGQTTGSATQSTVVRIPELSAGDAEPPGEAE